MPQSYLPSSLPPFIRPLFPSLPPSLSFSPLKRAYNFATSSRKKSQCLSTSPDHTNPAPRYPPSPSNTQTAPGPLTYPRAKPLPLRALTSDAFVSRQRVGFSWYGKSPFFLYVYELDGGGEGEARLLARQRGHGQGKKGGKTVCVLCIRGNIMRFGDRPL